MAREVHFDLVSFQIPNLSKFKTVHGFRRTTHTHFKRRILTCTYQHPTIRTPCQSINRTDMTTQSRNKLTSPPLPQTDTAVPRCTSSPSAIRRKCDMANLALVSCQTGHRFRWIDGRSVAGGRRWWEWRPEEKSVIIWARNENLWCRFENVIISCFS